MRIIQIVESFTYGDAIGDHVLALHNGFQASGIDSCIYATHVDSRMRDWAQSYELYNSQEGDLIYLHMSIGTPLNLDVVKHGCPIAVNYHNITPPDYFEGYDNRLAECCRAGREQLKTLAPYASVAIADSAYNAQELVDLGYTCDVHVVPILLNLAQYSIAKQNVTTQLAEMDSRPTKLLFVGRVVPNKRHELVLQAFYEYKRLYDPQAELTFVGTYRGSLPYYLRLRKYIRKLGLSNVKFAGHVEFEKMVAYYRSSDVFICESSHEGFCVPLIEAMFFELPIVAYDGSAVGETLGKGGLLLPDQLPRTAADAIHSVMTDANRRKQIKTYQAQELQRFDPQVVLEEHFVALGL